MRFNSILDLEQLHDSLTGKPLAGVALSDLYRCGRCTSSYRADSVQSLRDENGGACVACSAVGTIKAWGDTDDATDAVALTALVHVSRSGIKLIAQAARAGERDLLTGNEQAAFLLKDLSGTVLAEIAPRDPWTHEALFALIDRAEIVRTVAQRGGADAYLGTVWIGGTEV